MRRREDCLPDLPTKSYRYITVDCVENDPDLKQLCDEAYRSLLAYCEERGMTFEEALEEVQSTRGGVTFEMISRVRHRLALAKIPALMELVEAHEDAESPLVVFSRHRGPIDTLATRGFWGVVSGAESGERREETKAMFQAGKLKGVACTIQAGGVAITLTRAHEVIFVDRDWTPALNDQAEDRVCRIGQTRGVIVTILVADHALDERVAEVEQEKRALTAASWEASAQKGDPQSLEHADALRRLAEEQEEVVVQPTAAPPTNTRLAATTPRMEWTERALTTLAALDPDHAGERNEIGFNQLDNEFGHSLARQLQATGMLTSKQWLAGFRLCLKYRRQVGEPPELEEE
jgi:hypothetical protein